VVQEFYARLAAEQEAPGYWPARLVEESGSAEVAGVLTARKRVFPSSVVVPDGGEMEWMWWGLLCARLSDGGYVAAMQEASVQLYGHAGGLISARDRRWAAAGGGFDVSSALIGVLGLVGLAVAPPVGVALTVGGAVKAGWDNKGFVAKFKQWLDRRGQDREIDATDRGAEVEQIAEGLVRTSRQVPMVMVVDDAHWADQGLVEVIDRVLASPNARVLVIATTWPHALAAADDRNSTSESGDGSASGPFPAWWAARSGVIAKRSRRLDLDPLSDAETAEILVAELPGLDGERVEALLAHVENNPLTARILVRTASNREVLTAAEFVPEDLLKLPRDLDDALAVYWKEIPPEVQAVLATAAQLGHTFLNEAVLAAIGEADPNPEVALRRGADPYSWVRDLDEYVRSFLEPPMLQIAERAGRELLTPAKIRATRQALIDLATNTDTDALSPLGRETLWSQHVAFAHTGLAATETAARSAERLAALRAARYDYSSAIELAQQALEWNPANPDHPDTLTTRSNIASWWGEAGRVDEAIKQSTALLADRTRILGADHPDTLETRNNLAYWLAQTGRVDEAI
jgi:hypothetical protein